MAPRLGTTALNLLQNQCLPAFFSLSGQHCHSNLISEHDNAFPSLTSPSTGWRFQTTLMSALVWTSIECPPVSVALALHSSVTFSPRYDVRAFGCCSNAGMGWSPGDGRRL